MTLRQLLRSTNPGIRYLILCGLIVPALSLGVTATAQGGIIISTHEDVSVDGTSFLKGDLFSVDGPVGELKGSDVFDGTENIGAAHRISATRYLLAADGHVKINNIDYKKEDIFEFDTISGTATMILDGSDGHFNEKIDAVHLLANGRLLISTDAKATISGFDYEKGDVFEYDIVNKTASMYFKGEDVFTKADEDINGLYLTGAGTLLFSTSGDADFNPLIASLSITSEQIVEFNPGPQPTASIYWDGSPHFPGKHINAITITGTPEPSSMALLILVGLTLTGRRRRDPISAD